MYPDHLNFKIVLVATVKSVSFIIHHETVFGYLFSEPDLSFVCVVLAARCWGEVISFLAGGKVGFRQGCANVKPSWLISDKCVGIAAFNQVKTDKLWFQIFFFHNWLTKRYCCCKSKWMCITHLFVSDGLMFGLTSLGITTKTGTSVSSTMFTVIGKTASTLLQSLALCLCATILHYMHAPSSMFPYSPQQHCQHYKHASTRPAAVPLNRIIPSCSFLFRPVSLCKS